MFLKKSKVKGKVYYQAYDDERLVEHIGTAEKILKMKKFYDKHKKILSKWSVVQALQENEKLEKEFNKKYGIKS